MDYACLVLHSYILHITVVVPTYQDICMPASDAVKLGMGDQDSLDTMDCGWPEFRLFLASAMLSIFCGGFLGVMRASMLWELKARKQGQSTALAKTHCLPQRCLSAMPSKVPHFHPPGARSCRCRGGSTSTHATRSTAAWGNQATHALETIWSGGGRD